MLRAESIHVYKMSQAYYIMYIKSSLHKIPNGVFHVVPEKQTSVVGSKKVMKVYH